MRKGLLPAALLLLFTGTTSLAFEMPPVPVKVTSPKPIKWQKTLTFFGSVNAMQGIAVKPEVSGRITGILFKSGSKVKAGQPIIQLNPDILTAEKNLIEANLKLSKLQLERQERLSKQNATPESKLNEAQANYGANEARLEKVDAELNQLLIRAPFSGMLGIRDVSLGDYIDTTDKIVQLQHMDTVYTDFTLPQNYISNIKIGDNITVRANMYPHKIFKGKISAMDSEIDPLTRSIKIRAAIPNHDHKLIPGAFVSVAIRTNEVIEAMSLPQIAAVYDSSGSYIYTVKNNQASRQNITILEQTDGKIILNKNNLDQKMVVITEGQLKISPGSKVMVMPAKTQASPKKATRQ